MVNLVSLVVPLCVVLAGLSFAGFFASSWIPPLLEEVERGNLQEGFEARVPAIGDYTVWLYTKGALGDKDYSGDVMLPPGAKIFLFDSANGRQIPLHDTVQAQRNLNGESAVSLGNFFAERVNEVVEVKGTGLNMPVLVGIAPASSRQVVMIVLLVSGVVIGSILLAGILFVFLQRFRDAGG